MWASELWVGVLSPRCQGQACPWGSTFAAKKVVGIRTLLRRLSHEVAAACSRGRQPAVPVESSGKSHEVATAGVVVACYRHFVANQCWAIRYRGLTPTAICYHHFVASLDRPWSPGRKHSGAVINRWRCTRTDSASSNRSFTPRDEPSTRCESDADCDRHAGSLGRFAKWR